MPDNEEQARQGRLAWSVPGELMEYEPLPLLVQLSDEEWVNPQHVVSVVYLSKDSMTAENDPRVIVTTTKGAHVIRDRTAVEIVTLFNGEAE